MNKIIVFSIIGIILVIAGIVFFSGNTSSFENIALEDEITVYKSSSCGCCGVYVNYFQRKGNSNANFVDFPNLEQIKSQYGVPQELESCHTTIIGDYFVEGHIPLEVVERLLEEKPDIAGIAMPGMPEGSPGMPGPKNSDFVIYAVNHDGSYEEFMRV